jgi:hypothetical protein
LLSRLTCAYQPTNELVIKTTTHDDLLDGLIAGVACASFGKACVGKPLCVSVPMTVGRGAVALTDGKSNTSNCLRMRWPIRVDVVWVSLKTTSR